MAQSTPWAILVCDFDEGADTPISSLDYLRNLYTDAGVGTGNIIDYFDIVSHGAIDLRGSRVFARLALGRPRSDYIGNVGDDMTPQGKMNRNGLIRHARSVAAQNGIDLSAFFSVVVLTTPAVDLFGNIVPYGAVAATNSTPQLLLQEMGHGYGLEHSRSAQGPFESGDYGDRFDIMSGPNCQGFYGPYGLIGPGLSAANMRGRGWLDESRVLQLDPQTQQFPVTVELRPLHATELPGYLAVSLGDIFVTLRDPTGWDAGLTEPVVLVHYLDADVSYLSCGTRGQDALAVGDDWWWGSEFESELPWTEMHVDAIDQVNRTATVTIRYRQGTGPHIDIYIDVTKLPPWDLKDFVVDDLRQPVWRSGDLVFQHVVPTEITGIHG